MPKICYMQLAFLLLFPSSVLHASTANIKSFIALQRALATIIEKAAQKPTSEQPAADKKTLSEEERKNIRKAIEVLKSYTSDRIFELTSYIVVTLNLSLFLSTNKKSINTIDDLIEAQYFQLNFSQPLPKPDEYVPDDAALLQDLEDECKRIWTLYIQPPSMSSSLPTPKPEPKAEQPKSEPERTPEKPEEEAPKKEETPKPTPSPHPSAPAKQQNPPVKPPPAKQQPVPSPKAEKEIVSALTTWAAQISKATKEDLKKLFPSVKEGDQTTFINTEITKIYEQFDANKLRYYSSDLKNSIAILKTALKKAWPSVKPKK